MNTPRRSGSVPERISATLAVLGCLAMLGGCGKSEEPEPMPVEDTVFGDQVEQIDRTKERVKEMEGRMQDLNRQLDSAESAPASEDDAETDSRN